MPLSNFSGLNIDEPMEESSRSNIAGLQPALGKWRDVS